MSTPSTEPTTVFVCTTCRQPHLKEAAEGAPCGEALSAHLKTAAQGSDGVVVEEVACLMGCTEGCNVAVTAGGKMTYVLGRFTPDDAAAQAIVDYASAHASSETGVVPFRTWPQGVKGHFRARVPALSPVRSPG
ncbi:MAG: DUF1636 domain-containing protein [Pseudomonadota bacterium]